MGENLVFQVDKVLTPLEELGDCRIRIRDGVIEDIEKIEESSYSLDEEFSSCIAVPGFIDIHMHGYGGNSTSSARSGELKSIAESLPKYGVTSFLPSTMSGSESKLVEIAEKLGQTIESDYEGAEILGLHLEGPHFGAGDEKGAQNSESLRKPDISELERVIEASGGNLKRVTLAPELPGAIEYIKKAKSMGLAVSVGHTAADYEKSLEALEKGVSIINHLYNGMKGFHHREPGMIGASLTSDDVFAEVIADLVHLHPAAIELAIRAKGLDKLILISDSISATGLPDGEYELGGRKVEVKNGVSRIKETGRLAGSTLTLDQAVKNLVEALDLDLTDVVRMATLNPANALGLEKRGKLAEGYKGDITILDEDLNVVATIVGGNLIWKRENR